MSLPTYAALGHPNEGKSSVISTLTENDAIRISPTPGETIACARYTLDLDGEPALVLIDTPGFQNPEATLKWMKTWDGPEKDLVPAFLLEHQALPEFHHDCELLKPLQNQAGILYVADASRPLREVDRQEMEILRLTGLPRLALLNLKKDERRFLEDWKEALSRRFNLIREFNAHHASFSERIDLLVALQQLTPGDKDHLQSLQHRLEEEWHYRAEQATLILETLWLQTLRHRVRIPLDPSSPEAPQLEQAREQYRQDIRTFEKKARAQWKNVYLHGALPPGGSQEGLFTEELFAEKVWRILGLSRRQLSATGAVAGGALGAGVDLAAGGITFGVFAAAGAVAGGLGGWVGGPKLGAKKLPLPGSHTLAREQIEVGPFANPQLLFVLLDRALLYLYRLMNWSHGRRDSEAFFAGLMEEKVLAKSWSDAERKLLNRWMKTHLHPGHSKAEEASSAFRALIREKLTA